MLAGHKFALRKPYHLFCGIWDLTHYLYNNMKETLKNAYYMARRFKIATTLNLFGLVVAFAACYMLLTQIIYQFTYNRGVDDYQRLYRMESNFTYREWESSEHMCRPFAEGLKALPQVESYSLVENNSINSYSLTCLKGGDEHEFVFSIGNNTAVSTLTSRVLDGKIEWTDDNQDGIIIPSSIAQEYFGTSQAADSVMLINHYGEWEKKRVLGVYEDFPENCEFSKCIFYTMKDSDLTVLGPYYKCYVKFTEGKHDFNAIVKSLKQAAIDSLIANSHRIGEEPDPDAIEDIQKINIKFIPLKDCFFQFTSFTQGEHGYRVMFYVLVLACLLIIIISTINFLNFTLAESPMRIRGLNTRLVLGAKRNRLRVSMVVECVFTSLCACLIGLALCGLLSFVPSLNDFDLSTHWLLVAFLLLLSVVLGIIAGVYPAIFATSFSPAMALKSSYGLTPQGIRLRTVLIFLQLFASVFMVIYIGCLFLQIRYIYNSDYGYDKNNILVCPLDEHKQTGETILQTLVKNPAINKVSLSSGVIGSTDAHYMIKTKFQDILYGYNYMYVDHQYLSTMGIKIIEGRDFLPSDTAAIIINEAFYRTIGVKVGDKISSGDEPSDSAVIVGVCTDIRYGTVFTGNDQPYGFIIEHSQYVPKYVLNINVGPTDNLDTVLQQVQKVLKLHDIDNTPIRYDKTLETTYQRELRFINIIGILSVICIMITLIGVFCLTMFETEYRRKEIGIRKVLGAKSSEIVKMFCGHYVPLILLSFVTAAPLACFFGWLTLKHFRQHADISWWIFPIALVVVGCVTLATVALKSWRTARENPSNSIKNE